MAKDEKELLDFNVDVKAKTGVQIGKGIAFETIRKENDAVIVAIGAWTSSKMRVPGEDLKGVLGGIDFLRDVALGGGYDFEAEKADLCSYSPSKTFDVVTLLEVLEHIPDVKTAIRNAVKLSNKYIVVTVPSKADDNPEHVHLLTREKLTEYFGDCGVKSLSFDGVQGHLFMIARK